LKKTGLFFGSFNPIHIGHLALANYMLSFAGIDELWFVVTPLNPLKKKSSLLADHHRLEMVQLAIQNADRMKASNIEFKLPQPNYTINTLTHLKEKFPEHTFFPIIGSDNLETFHKWKNHEQILKQYQILVYPRFGFDANEWKENKKVKWTEAPKIEISSTFIRNAIKKKKDVRFFLPEAVWNYIDKMNFYRK
jgi:nicotinate-nucleotide adenylyltransferase